MSLSRLAQGHASSRSQAGSRTQTPWLPATPRPPHPAMPPDEVTEALRETELR